MSLGEGVGRHCDWFGGLASLENERPNVRMVEVDDREEEEETGGKEEMKGTDD